MIDLKTFKENASKYLNLCMIEVQPQDVVEICERAIVAEHCVEIIRQNHQNLINELTKAAREIRELTTKLSEIEKQKPAYMLDYEYEEGHGNPDLGGDLVFHQLDGKTYPLGTEFYTRPVQLPAAMPRDEEQLRTIFENSYNNPNSPPQPDGQGGYHRTRENCTIDNDWSEWKRCWLACKEGVKAFTPQPKLAVWYGPMPESNGKTNWTALLHRETSENFNILSDGITISRSEYPERVLYEADRVRYLIGELEEMPDILAYDADKHSGYVEQPDSTAPKLFGYVLQDREDFTFHKHKPASDLELSENEVIAHKVYLHPPTKSQRITEQDAREIAESYALYCMVEARSDAAAFAGWFGSPDGRALLDKLNEHREPNLQTHNLNHLELIKAKQYSFMNCALCSHSVNVAVLVRSTNCSVHICESCAHAIDSEFKQPTQR